MCSLADEPYHRIIYELGYHCQYLSVKSPNFKDPKSTQSLNCISLQPHFSLYIWPDQS